VFPSLASRLVVATAAFPLRAPKPSAAGALSRPSRSTLRWMAHPAAPSPHRRCSPPSLCSAPASAHRAPASFPPTGAHGRASPHRVTHLRRTHVVCHRSPVVSPSSEPYAKLPRCRLIRAACSTSDLRAIHGLSHVSSCVVHVLVVVHINRCLHALVKSFRYIVHVK
jgi:hypothetical protein